MIINPSCVKVTKYPGIPRPGFGPQKAIADAQANTWGSTQTLQAITAQTAESNNIKASHSVVVLGLGY